MVWVPVIFDDLKIGILICKAEILNLLMILEAILVGFDISSSFDGCVVSQSYRRRHRACIHRRCHRQRHLRVHL